MIHQLLTPTIGYICTSDAKQEPSPDQQRAEFLESAKNFAYEINGG